MSICPDPDEVPRRLRDSAAACEAEVPEPALRHALSTPLGGVLCVAGLVFVVLPGPSLPLILAGLALLAPEYPWARSVLRSLVGLVPPRWRPRLPSCARHDDEASSCA